MLALIVGGDISHGAMFWGGLCGVSPGIRHLVVLRRVGCRPDLGGVAADGDPGRRRSRSASGLALGERPGAVAGVGVVLALVAVVLVSREATDEDVTPHRFTTKVAWLTVGSGVAFGLNFVLIAQAPPEAKLWPLVFARLAASLVVVVIAAVTGNSRCRAGTPLRLALLAAVLDVGANVAMLLALACVSAVAGRRADVAVSGGDGTARDRGAAGEGHPVAGRRHGAGSCGRRHDCRGLAALPGNAPHRLPMPLTTSKAATTAMMTAMSCLRRGSTQSCTRSMTA